MSENCNHNCESCTSKCAQGLEKEKLNAFSSVKKAYAVVSGKGGVGKSLVTGLLSVLASKSKKTAILDADLTGPSIPKMFGVKEKALGCENGIYPATSKGGISINIISSSFHITSVQNCFTVPARTGPRHTTGSVSSSSKRFIDIISMPPLLVAG